MTTYNKHSELIDALKLLSEKLERGELSLEELSEFQRLAQQLYERVVVLNFKAKEKFISTEQKKPVSSSSVNENNQEKALVEKKEEPQSQPEEPEGILFDFSSEDSDKNVTVDEKKEEPEITENEESAEEPKIVEDLKEDEIIETVVSEEESTETIKVTTTTLSEISAEDAVYFFYEKFTQVHDDSLMEQLSSQKIESLKGAFGLNDKFQIINDLFNGNNEAFEEAINSLDNQSSGQKARITLSEIAAQHQWEPDNLLVEDFAKMIERRYA